MGGRKSSLHCTWSGTLKPDQDDPSAFRMSSADMILCRVTLGFRSVSRLTLRLFGWQASVCFCQVMFMTSRAPRVTWEACYLPLVETILYGLAASGNGLIRLSDGRIVPIARFCSWLITCPIMLFQIMSIHEVKWKGQSLKNLIMAASLIRTVFGIGASVTANETHRWVQYCLGVVSFLFELTVVYQVFQGGMSKFAATKSILNDMVYFRLGLMRILFFVSWVAFPVTWVLSSTGMCLIGEDASVCECHLLPLSPHPFIRVRVGRSLLS